MSDKGKREGRSRIRRVFRFARRFIFVILVLLLGAVLWLNYFGLPGFLQTRILGQLATADFDLNAARVRLEGISRLIVENLQFAPTSTNNLPRLDIEEAQVLFDRSALGGLRFELKGLLVRDGRLEWLLERPGKSSELLLVTNLQSELIFLPDQQWHLTDLRGETAGAKVTITATLKNPSALKFTPSEGKPDLPPKWQEQIADVLELLRELEFGSQPELSLQFEGDAADPSTIRASAKFKAWDLQSSWGHLKEMEFLSRLQPADEAFENITMLRLAGATSQWLQLGRAEVHGRALLDTSGSKPSSLAVDLRVEALQTPWGKLDRGSAAIASTQQDAAAPYKTSVRASASPVEAGNWRGTNLVLQTDLAHSLPVPSLATLMKRWLPGGSAPAVEAIPANHLSGEWRIQLGQVHAPRFVADSLNLSGSLGRDSFQQREVDPALSFWHWLLPYQISWSAALSNIYSAGIELGSARAQGTWNPPTLEVKTINAELYGGSLAGKASVDVVSREAEASAEADFDYHKVSLLLEEPVQKWLSQFSWEKAPWVQGSLKLQLPAWNESWERFDRQVLPSLVIDGQFRGAGAFRGIPAEHAESHFHFENFTWHLPNLAVTRPEGKALFAYTGNVSNQDFQFDLLSSRIDPAALKPLVEAEHQMFFDFVSFPEPPLVQGRISGNWREDERLYADVQIAVTNFFVKGEQYSGLTTSLRYTNLIIECENVLGHRGTETVRAPYLRIDITNEVMFVTNAISTSDPYVAMKLIGEKVYAAIDPYRFATPPTVRINGLVPLRHYTKSDLHFEVAGEDFSFWKLRIPSVVGDIFWKGDYLSFSNVQASFYGGQAAWSGSFVFDRDNDAEFSFAGRTVDSDLSPLVADLFPSTNRLEGLLTGDLVITSAKSIDDKSWNGYGTMELKEGFLWNIPVFGVFTPMLESVAPGLGTSKVTAGTADFTITNTVFHSQNMEVRAPAFRLRYDGHVDLEGNLDADVEAILLRDAWVLGPLFSLALWPVSKVFEAEVSGTVAVPITRFKYVPRFLLAPFKALNALKTSPDEKADPGPPKPVTPE